MSVFLFFFRRLEDLQSQLAEEKDQVARLNEQLQQEKSHRERDLTEARETHHSQISDLQEKISSLVAFHSAPCLDCFLFFFLKTWKQN